MFRGDTEALHTDMSIVIDRLGRDVPLDDIVGKLKGFYARGRISVSHALAELVVAHYLRSRGYERVDVEHSLAPRVVCDVYGELGGNRVCVEVEHGFVPPEHATEPISYLRARMVKKLAVISAHIDVPAMAVPPYYVPPVPLILLRPPHLRMKLRHLVSGIVEEVKRHFPDADAELLEKQLTNMELGFFLIVDIDSGRAIEIAPQQMEVLLTTRDSFLV